MGMFDYIRVECELPSEVPDIEKAEWQSKDTPAQYLDEYFLTPDGKLEHTEYDTEIEKTDEAPFGFYLHRRNCRRVFCNKFTGSIRFYAKLPSGRFEFCAFVEWGKVIKIIVIEKPK